MLLPVSGTIFSDSSSREKGKITLNFHDHSFMKICSVDKVALYFSQNSEIEQEFNKSQTIFLARCAHMVFNEGYRKNIFKWNVMINQLMTTDDYEMHFQYFWETTNDRMFLAAIIFGRIRKTLLSGIYPISQDDFQKSKSLQWFFICETPHLVPKIIQKKDEEIAQLKKEINALKEKTPKNKIPNVISMPKINVSKKKKTIATVATITDQPKTKEKAIQCSVKPVFGVEMYMLIVERITLFFIWLFQLKNIYYKLNI